MNTNDTFLAIFLASKTSARMTAWNALSEEARGTKMQEGIAAWKAWVEKGQRSCEPHQQAEHMAAPTNVAFVKKVLANSEPSTHGP